MSLLCDARFPAYLEWESFFSRTDGTVRPYFLPLCGKFLCRDGDLPLTTSTYDWINGLTVGFSGSSTYGKRIPVGLSEAVEGIGPAYTEIEATIDARFAFRLSLGWGSTGATCEFTVRELEFDATVNSSGLVIPFLIGDLEASAGHPRHEQGSLSLGVHNIVHNVTEDEYQVGYDPAGDPVSNVDVHLPIYAAIAGVDVNQGTTGTIDLAGDLFLVGDGGRGTADVTVASAHLGDFVPFTRLRLSDLRARLESLRDEWLDTLAASDSFNVEIPFIDAALAEVADGSGHWTFEYAASMDGIYAFTATATDAAGNASSPSAALLVTVDTVAPSAPEMAAITEDTGTPGDRITFDASVVVHGKAEADARVSLLVDGSSVGATTADGVGNWSFDYTSAVRADGVHTWTATAADVAGNTSALSAAFVVTVDTVGPTDIRLPNTGVAENLPAGALVGVLSAVDETPDDSHTYQFVAGEGGEDNSLFALNGNQLLTGRRFDYEIRNAYTIRLRVTDAAGEFQDQTFRISVTDVAERAWRLTVELRDSPGDLIPNSGATLEHKYRLVHAGGDHGQAAGDLLIVFLVI